MDRIFVMGYINLNPTIYKFINIGLKYVPSFNKINIYLLLFNLYNSLYNFNKNNFFLSSKNKTTNNTTHNEDTILNYLKREFTIPDKTNYPILQSTREFHNHYLSNILKEVNISYAHNSLNSFQKIIKEIKNNEIIITNCDKNVGIALVEKKIYRKLCFDHLNDNLTYEKINYNPHFFLINHCQQTINDLNKNNHISDTLFNKLSTHIKNKKLPNFKLYPKLHKKKFGIRPLINCKNSTTSPISKTIDFFLKNIVYKHFSYIQDSQAFIQKTYNKTFEKNNKIYTADIVSLYTNIPILEAIEIISSQFIPKIQSQHFNSYGLHTLLKLVLLNSFFMLKIDKTPLFFKQIKGVPMGTACGPTIANLYLASYEIKNKHLINSSLYYRFIDDLILISKDQINIDYMKKLFPTLDLTVESNNKLAFLDLELSLSPINSINFNVFIKPTNTRSYLEYSSNHTPFISKNIPKGLIYRIRRICTNLNQFLYHCTLIHSSLLERGYNSKKILSTIRSFSNIKRDTLIPYKEKSNFINNSVIYITYFDKIIPNQNTFLHNIWGSKVENNIFLKKFIFKTFYKIYPNLNQYLANKIKSPYCSNKYIKCLKLNCTICQFSNTNYNLENKYNLPILIPNISSCDSKNCIYIIQCKKCIKNFYIGETSRSINIRIKEHIQNIKRVQKLNLSELNYFLSKTEDCKILYKHFSLHKDLSNFSFQVFIDNCITYRTRLESDLMILLDTINPNGLNANKSINLKYLENYNIK